MTDKIEELVGQLTIQEKVSLLAGADAWNTVAIERLGIPALKVSDGPNGARGSDGNAGPASAAFPVGIAMGATWNVELVSRIGTALAQETRAKGAHILLAPTVNIHRSPLAGRNFECFSEDPFLTSRMAVAYINGLQGGGVGACIKHFICNESEFERFTMSSEVNERALHEIYLPPFKAAVEECNPWAVMSSYNKINGVWVSENSDLLLNLLKGIWQFDGIVISDWYGTNSTGVVNGGLDLEMPGPARWMGSHIIEGIARGDVLEEAIDDKVKRLLATIVKAGGLENLARNEEIAVDDPSHRQLIREAAGEAIVLLKNQDGLLPIRSDRVRRIAIVGPNAKTARIMGGGSSRIAPHYAVTPFDGICGRAGDSFEIEYEIGCTNHKMLPLLETDRLMAIDRLSRGLTAEYFNDQELSGRAVFTQVIRSSAMSWFGDLPEVVDPDGFSLRLSGTYLAPETGIYEFGLESTGLSRLFVDGEKWLDSWTSSEQEGPSGAHDQQRAAKIPLIAEQAYEISAEFRFEKNVRWRAVR